MKWENDYIKIYFPKHKFDQIGLNKDDTRQVFSNHNDPSVCPLRALTSYLFVFPSIFGDGKNCSLEKIKRSVSILAHTE